MGTLYRLASHSKHTSHNERFYSSRLRCRFIGSICCTPTHPWCCRLPICRRRSTRWIRRSLPLCCPRSCPRPPSSQFQAQDEFGNLNYGYANINSQKHEVGNTYGGVTGSYSYVDANGVVQTANYIADHLGFRVQATNLPVAPAAPEVELPNAPVHEYTLPVAPVDTGVAPEPVQDTPEVAEAKAAHLAPLAEATAAERRRRSTPADTEVLEAPEPVKIAAPIAAPIAPLAGYPYGVLPYAGLPHAGLPLAGAYGYTGLPHLAGHAYAGLPVAPAVAPAAVVPSVAGATAEAELHTVKLTPGHAVAYRVY